jgi:alpha-L-fucosidase
LKNFSVVGFLILLVCLSCQKPYQGAHVVAISENDTTKDIIRKAASVTPSPEQLAWQEMEFTAFIHFTVNTFTDQEWGHGDEEPQIFNPTELDARQWARVCKEAGMKMIILTAKHHDGFCLWPSELTEHSVKNSPWKNGRGDVVRDVADACKEFGLKFGVYLSPWDRHEPTYGDSPKYNEYFRNQLTELLTNYGTVDEVWFDGACGEGPNGKRQEYDFPSYYRLIRQLQPHAVIAIAGPDVRWVGTESGYGRKTEWSVVPAQLSDQEKIAADSQQNIDYKPLGNMMDSDLGSRDKLQDAKTLIWYPSEVDVSIRPGWFYHASQDLRVKSPQKLVDIYYSSVGRNSLLLLNLPPDRRGLIHENDVKSLQGMRKILDTTFAQNLAAETQASASSVIKGHKPEKTIDGNSNSFWQAAESESKATLEFNLGDEQLFDRLLLQEHIRTGQRIEKFSLQAWDGQEWQVIAGGTTVGYKRLLRFPAVRAAKVRLVIEESRTNPTLAEFGLFKSSSEENIETQ